MHKRGICPSRDRANSSHVFPSEANSSKGPGEIDVRRKDFTIVHFTPSH